MTLSILGSFKLLLFLTVYVLTVHQVASQDEEVSEEVSSRSNSCRAILNKPGACISLRKCEPFIRLLKSRPFQADRVIRRSICGGTRRDRLVCCPGVESNSNNSGNNNNNKGNGSDKKPKNKVQPLKPPQCGRSNKAHNRVVGGTPAEVGAWPWIANVGVEVSPNEVGFGCGGTLISSRHVVTAGHCVYGVEDRFFVRLGEHDLSSDNDGANPIDVLVEKVTLHPRYDHKFLSNDIAILKLAKEVKFTDAIHPICLPVEDDIKNRNFVNNYPFVAGWGKTSSGGSTSDILRETQIPVVSLDACKKAYRNFGNVNVDNRVICAGYAQGGKDACQGDSGGPLMFPKNQSYYLIGVVSGGYKCAQPGIPGIYTRVTSFLDFILSNMN